MVLSPHSIATLCGQIIYIMQSSMTTLFDWLSDSSFWVKINLDCDVIYPAQCLVLWTHHLTELLQSFRRIWFEIVIAIYGYVGRQAGGLLLAKRAKALIGAKIGWSPFLGSQGYRAEWARKASDIYIAPVGAKIRRSPTNMEKRAKIWLSGLRKQVI